MGLNMAMQPQDPKVAQAEQEKSAKKAETDGKAAKKAADELTTSGGGNELAALGDDVTLGDKKADKEIVIGYSWTPAVQGDPGKVYRVVDEAQKNLPGVRVRVVNVDANPTIKPGITVEGKLVAPPDADGGYNLSPETIGTIRKMVGLTPKNAIMPPGV